MKNRGTSWRSSAVFRVWYEKNHSKFRTKGIVSFCVGVFYQNSPGMQITKCSFEETILAKSFAIRYIMNGIDVSERLRFEKIKEMDILRKQ